MQQALYEGAVEYDDGRRPTRMFYICIDTLLLGTPAIVPQMAKDVCTFLRWAAEPEIDDRKRMGMKVIYYNQSAMINRHFSRSKALMVLSVIAVISYYTKRHRWSSIESRKIIYKPS